MVVIKEHQVMAVHGREMAPFGSLAAVVGAMALGASKNTLYDPHTADSIPISALYNKF